MFYIIYYGIYALMFVISLIIVFISTKKIILNDKSNNILITIFSVLLIVLFGTRDYTIGADTQTYIGILEGFGSGYLDSVKDIGFYFLLKFVYLIGTDSFLLMMSLLYIAPLSYLFCKLKFKNKFIFFFVFASSFFFLSMGINILRQGIAISFMLLFLYYLEKKRTFQYIVMLLIALSFHFAVIIFIPCLLIAQSIKIKTAVLIFIVSTFISYFGVGLIKLLSEVPVVSYFFHNRVDSYINSEETVYKIGFRIDFLMYNIIFIFISYFLVLKRRLLTNDYSDNYLKILKLYILLSSIFVLCFHIPYSDRVGVLSWVLSPFLLIPLLSTRQINRNVILALSVISLNVLIFIII